MPNTHNPISYLIILYLTSFCIQTLNTMNSALTLVSYHSPSFNLKQRPPSRHQQISANRGTRQQCFPKPIRAILGSNATGGLSNAYRGGNALPSSPLTDVIQEFYSSINDKDMTRLKKLLAPDCVVEHTSYYKPLDVKNTHTYFTRLMAAMRKNVKFAIDEVCQGVEPTVAVMWHLEWNGKIIPFTKGSGFYMCSAKGESLLIRKVHIFNESPLKPGKPALEVLLFVAKLFDTLPKEAEAFLQNPEALVQPIVKLYKFCVEPFVVYLLAYYIHFWSFVAQGLTMVLGILYNILKRFM
ncbi:hypothetical protein QYE76_050675 [Lolium multiflorum]|uniref:SnoaL-like domain-containing protein n=1 Tax=Lolium multiflorum TaxID=4521 RepID=A0AAD8WI17_LOLMU|nr:hypothetical protein QYE76_050675 [Lolium multiflorum]